MHPRHLDKRRSANDAAYILAFGERLLQQSRVIISSTKISHSGHAIRVLTLMSSEVNGLSNGVV